MKKLWRTIKSLWQGLFWGMKSADEMVFQNNENNIPGNAIIQEVNDKRVSKALLRGEVTQEVEELRYRTYKIDREAKTYEYFAPTLAFKKEHEKDNDNKFISYENSENLEIITIQPNECDIENITDSLRNVDFNKAKVINVNGTNEFEVELGHLQHNNNFTIKLKRDFYPRYKLETYTKKLVVKKINDTHVLLDFYVSKYPNPSDFKSKGFVREIEKIKDEGMKSDVIDFSRVYFVTLHAYKLVDMLEFEFKHIEFNKIIEYDGNYIIKFYADVSKGGLDLTDKYYCKTMDEKYKNKVKKDVVIDILNSDLLKVYKCEHCGKEIYYDPEQMDKQEITRPRDIDEEINEEETTSLTEYRDAKISYETYGIMLCKNCLKKYIQENNL